jgi:hypothetical protein
MIQHSVKIYYSKTNIHSPTLVLSMSIIHNTHNSKTAGSHGVEADGMNKSCHGRNRDSGYRQTLFLILPCHNWGNYQHYKDHHTIDNQEGVDET